MISAWYGSDLYYILTSMAQFQKKNMLVGGLNPSEKYLSVGMIIPNLWKNRKCSKAPTRF